MRSIFIIGFYSIHISMKTIAEIDIVLFNIILLLLQITRLPSKTIIVNTVGFQDLIFIQ